MMSTSSTSVQSANLTSEEVGWTNSRSYLGFQPQEWEKFWRFQHKRRRKGSLIAKSPFIPVNMREWVEHRLEVVLDRIETEKARIQACEKEISCVVRIVPAFGGKTGMLRSAALDHFHRQFSLERLAPDNSEQGLLETEAFRARAEELVGGDLMKKL